ncbi:ATP-dependent zinc metalloprotease FTSH 11, chloroplastic/mitochondrial [Auxenochlorella protothecoides]|uniref:ATP-dependent zinc metalloprotease FTSH 11, chloroplastic/mitochondrial n=1 Tax=Auxenochlorella protothecoides TaxID=3075 RepID=A0A087SGR0_AUXPR|nr:ATP-dependent zinc metalloprotease FTSH 11, chloroplastic/mitochondrial [Auxenochlorella protothecoides]KFM24914.1 ATP-dependent zinc metalloprotease FTSH 11, chloroplastic/mitochondrial [Auxenochlorella protothecoides]
MQHTRAVLPRQSLLQGPTFRRTSASRQALNILFKGVRPVLASSLPSGPPRIGVAQRQHRLLVPRRLRALEGESAEDQSAVQAGERGDGTLDEPAETVDVSATSAAAAEAVTDVDAGASRVTSDPSASSIASSAASPSVASDPGAVASTTSSPTAASAPTDTAGADPAPAPSRHPAVMLAAALAAGVSELTRLTLLVPLRWLLLSAVRWVLARTGLLALNARREFRLLEVANAAGRLDGRQVAAVMAHVSRQQPEVTVEWFERACLGQGAGGGSGGGGSAGPDRPGPARPPVEVSAAGAREYLAALVAMGRLRDYGDAPPSGLVTFLHSALSFGLTLALLGFISVLGLRATQRAAGVNSSAAMGEALAETSVKSFEDVKGCDEALTELQEIVTYLKTPEKFTRLGGKLPKGVLLTGPPGTGKTLLARAVAGEAGVPFFYKAGSEFDEMFVGVGSRRVRNLFAAAKAKSPCIVFIDEVDAVGGKRTNWEASGGSRKTLNQLLTEMDGFEENSGVVVMAATNLPETLDPALTRPGRFDRQVAVPLPDVHGRRAILDLYFKGKPLAADVDSDSLARRTPGFSGAQLSNLVNEAALLAARTGRDCVDAGLLDEARDKILMGSPRALSQTLEARRLTAYHESGHALVALFTPGARPIHKATIIPRGHALGMVSQLPDRDEYSTTKQQLLAQIDVCMGGKAAEELIFGEEFVTTGATSDLSAATRTARHMVEDCGMSARIGPLSLSDKLGSETRKVADAEVSDILKASYERVRGLLTAHQAGLHALAASLLEQETLTQSQIKEVTA